MASALAQGVMRHTVRSLLVRGITRRPIRTALAIRWRDSSTTRRRCANPWAGVYQPITARLSEQLANPGVSAPAGKAVRGLFNNPLVLGGLIVVLVVVLAWGLYRAGRRIEQLPKDPGGAAS
jgi:hypothetical protein